MMQMLLAGGIPILTDGIRQPDEDNPHGYLEYEPAKLLQSKRDWLDSASGHAVKVIHLLLPELPSNLQYRIIFVRREMSEILESQKAMLGRLGRRGPSILGDELAKAYQVQIERVYRWLASAANIQLLEVAYADMLADANSVTLRVQEFLECELDRAAMRQAVDPKLYRNRSKHSSGPTTP